MFSGGVSRTALPTRKRHVTVLPAGGEPMPRCPGATGFACWRSFPSWEASAWHKSTDTLGFLIFLSRVAAPHGPGLRPDGSRLAAAAQEHLPRGWGLLPSLQHSFQPTALHIQYHQIIYSRCQLQATAKEKVYLRYHVDCYTRS